MAQFGKTAGNSSCRQLATLKGSKLSLVDSFEMAHKMLQVISRDKNIVKFYNYIWEEFVDFYCFADPVKYFWALASS